MTGSLSAINGPPPADKIVRTPRKRLLSQCHASCEPKPQKGLFPMISTASLDTPTDLKSNSARSVARALNGILADSFALYLKTKNFHWHASGPHFRDYHLLFDEQAAQ